MQRVGGSAKKIKGSLEDKTTRLPMSHPIFSRLEEMIKTPASSMQWFVQRPGLLWNLCRPDALLSWNLRFGMAEQALNAIYLLGEQPDVLAGTLIKDFTVRTFDAAGPDQVAEGIEGLTLGEREAAIGDATPPGDDPDDSMTEEAKPVGHGEGQGLKRSSSIRSFAGSDLVSSFELGQLIFVVGHVAIKQIVYLEIVERELKRRKEQQAAASTSNHSGR